MSTGRALRLSRLSRKAPGRYLFVPLDHSLSDGPIIPAENYSTLVRQLALGGADAIIVHKGRAQRLAPDTFTSCNLIVHLSASTAAGPDPDGKTLVGTAEECLRLGADAASIHFNLGSANEPCQLREIGQLARECDVLGLPLLAMVYARGPHIQDRLDWRLISHATAIAVDLGADLVKVPNPQTPGALSAIVRDCPVPVLVAGGAATESSPHEDARVALEQGCAGVAYGRRLFGALDPYESTLAVSRVVHATDIIQPVAP